MSNQTRPVLNKNQTGRDFENRICSWTGPDRILRTGKNQEPDRTGPDRYIPALSSQTLQPAGKKLQISRAALAPGHPAGDVAASQPHVHLGYFAAPQTPSPGGRWTGRAAAGRVYIPIYLYVAIYMAIYMAIYNISLPVPSLPVPSLPVPALPVPALPVRALSYPCPMATGVSEVADLSLSILMGFKRCGHDNVNPRG